MVGLWWSRFFLAKFPPSLNQQSEKNAAGIPAFVYMFLHVSEPVPCPASLHTSESGPRTIALDNSAVSVRESSAKSWDENVQGRALWSTTYEVIKMWRETHSHTFPPQQIIGSQVLFLLINIHWVMTYLMFSRAHSDICQHYINDSTQVMQPG